MLSTNLEHSLKRAVDFALSLNHEYTTLEHLLYAFMEDPDIQDIFKNIPLDMLSFREDLSLFILKELSYLKIKKLEESSPTLCFQRVLHRAILYSQTIGQKVVESHYVLAGFFDEKESFAVSCLRNYNIQRINLMQLTSHQPSSLARSIPTHDVVSIKDPLKSLNMDPQVPHIPGSNFKTATSSQQESTHSNQVGKYLKNFCVNLNERALKGKIDPITGRDEEIDRVIEILTRRTKNNPLLIGEAGVGKTAIAEGLAFKIIHQQVPSLLNARLYSLDLGLLIAGTRYRGDFEERLNNIISDIMAVPGAILFIDEIHNIVGTGSTQGGGIDASNLLKPALARGNLRCIGATTYKEFRQCFEKDRALTRRFQKVDVKEPSAKDTLEILKKIKKIYEDYHQVYYPDELLDSIVDLSIRYIHHRSLPDKAIDVLDEVGAYHKLQNKSSKKITLREVENIIARISKIPRFNITSREGKSILNLGNALKKKVFGQDEAIDRVVDAIQIAKAGLKHPEKPIAAFLFAGPTGVGKTELARQLSYELGLKLLRFDMSEYMEKHSIAKLIGSPPGYVGYEQGGALTDALDQHPHCVLLLDEIEKAHPELQSILLQIMDYGKVTDSLGKEIDCRNIILILTTNSGANDLLRSPMGFEKSDLKEAAESIEITGFFSPEFRNRLDGIVTFKRLSSKNITQVFDKFFQQTSGILKEKNIRLKMAPNVKDWFVKKGYSEFMGARPMERLIQENIKLPLSKKILVGSLSSLHQTLRIDLDQDKVIIITESNKPHANK